MRKQRNGAARGIKYLSKFALFLRRKRVSRAREGCPVPEEGPGGCATPARLPSAPLRAPLRPGSAPRPAPLPEPTGAPPSPSSPRSSCGPGALDSPGDGLPLRTGRTQASAEAPFETTFYQNHQRQERTLGALSAPARFLQKTGGQEGRSGRGVLQPGDLRFLREMTASTPRPSPAAGPAPARGLCTGRCARGRRPVGAPPPAAASVLNIHGDRYFLKGEPPRGSSPPRGRAAQRRSRLGAFSRPDAASAQPAPNPLRPRRARDPGGPSARRAPGGRGRSGGLGGGGRARSLRPNQLRVLRRGSRPGRRALL